MDMHVKCTQSLKYTQLLVWNTQYIDKIDELEELIILSDTMYIYNK